MSKAYTDEERIEIAKKEYDDWKLNYDVTLENDKSIGVISQVNDKPTGE